MNQYGCNDTEIDLVELLWLLLDKWKLLLIAGLLGVLLMMGYRQVTDNQVASQQGISIADAKERLSASEIGIAHAVYDKTRNIEALAEYVGTSYLMRVDPFNVEKVVLVYQLDGADLKNDVEKIEWKVSEARTLYSNYLSSAEFEDALAEKLAVEDGRSLAGLVELDGDNNDISLNFNKNYSTSTIKQNSNSSKNTLFAISVIIPQDFDETAFVDDVKACLNNYITDGFSLSRNDDSYTISYSFELKQSGYCDDIYRTQTTLQNLIYSENTELDNLKKKLSAGGKTYLDLLVNGEAEGNNKFLNFKDVVIGFGLGNVIACVIIGGYILFLPKASKLMGFGVLMTKPIIGCHIDNKDRNLFLCSALVHKFRNRKVKDAATEVDITASALAYYVHEVNSDSVSIVNIQTSEEKAHNNAIYINAIKDKSGISAPVITIFEKEIVNADLYEKLEAANDNIVFVLESGNVGINTLNKMASLIKAKDKSILGTVVFES